MRSTITAVVIASASALVAAVASGPPAGPGESAPEVPLDVREVAPGVLFFRPDAAIGDPTTIALLGDDETVLLDASIPEVAPVIDRYLSEHGARPVRRVVTTHAHRDHTDGLTYWTDHGAIAIAAPEQRTAMAGSPVIQEALAAGTDPRPTTLVEDSLLVEVTLGGSSLPMRVIRPPDRRGHTDGDLLVHLPTLGILYVGDFYFYGRYPVIDTDGGGRVGGYLADLDWIAATFPAATRVLPGHNAFAPARIELPDILTFRQWKTSIEATVDLVHAAKASGMTLEETVAEGLPARFRDLGQKPRYLSEASWIEALWR